MNDSKSHKAMKSSSFKFLLFSLFFATSSFGVFAQDDDGIYGDIYQAPEVEEELIDTTASPLDGYSTVDDYYPEEGYTSEDNSTQPYSEQYVDENGNNVTNNYYGDYYADDNDYAYSSRIRRFHRNNTAWGYYDPWYTNMYYYNYDPFFWGTSINVGFWPNYGWGGNNWGWGGGFGWNNGFNNGWGWNNGWNNGWGGGFGTPACFGGGFGGGWGGGNYWNGYNNGFNDGLAYGGYYNTFDSNSGIYYGHRGSTGNAGSTIGSGYRNTSIATAYNKAAQEGKVLHANKGNVLQTADARPVKGNVDGARSTVFKGEATRQTATTVNRGVSSERTKGEIATGTTRTAATATRGSAYQRGATERATITPERNAAPTVDRSRYRATITEPRRNPNVVNRGNTYQRGNEATRYSNRQQATQPVRSATDQNGNMYRDVQRTQPNSNGYNRNNSNRITQPEQGNRNSNQYSRPSTNQPSRNATNPSRNYQQPSRNATTPSRNYQQPSRSTQPSRNVSPAPSQNRGSSNRGSFSSPSPSRSSGSFGGSRGSSSSPSRGSSSPSRGGRP